MSNHGKKQTILFSFLCVILTNLQPGFAFQPIPKISFSQQKMQENGVQSTSIQTAKYIHDTDSNTPTLATDRRSIIKAAVSALLFTCPFTREQEISNALSGLVQFPCNHSFMNTYHFMRSGQSLLESEDFISTNPLFLTNREDALSHLGIEQVEDACEDMIARDINPTVVKYSLAAKSIESADIVASKVEIGRNKLVPEYTFMDPRGIGRWDMQRLSATEEAVWALDHAHAGKHGEEGLPPAHEDGTPNETLFNQATRLRELLSSLETHCSGDTILLIFPDGTGPALLSALIAGIPLYRVHELDFAPGEMRYNITAARVLQDLPNEPLLSYKAAITRGTATLERYEADPNQFLDLREEERLINEEGFRKRLAEKEAALREEAREAEEIQRNLAKKNIDLQEVKIAQEELPSKHPKKEIDLREKKKNAPREIHKKSGSREITGNTEHSKSQYQNNSNKYENSDNESNRKMFLTRDQKKEKTVFKGVKHERVESQGQTPDKFGKTSEARNIPNKRKNVIDRPKDKIVVQDKQVALNTIGSSKDSSIAAFTLVGAMAAFKLGAESTDDESQNDTNYVEYSEQTSNEPKVIALYDHNSTISLDIQSAESTATTGIVMVEPDCTDQTEENATIFEVKHELTENMIPVSQNLENATVGLDLLKIKEDNLDHKSQQMGKVKSDADESQSNYNVSLDSVEIKHKHSSSSASARIQEMENITTATTVNTNELNANKSEEQSLDVKVNTEHVIQHIDSDDAVEEDIMALPEIQKLHNLDKTPPFDIHELTVDLAEVDAGKSEKEEKIAHANKVMEDYLSQDDGTSDWLELMSDLMDSQ